MMIDFHAHILPDMDDGAKSTEESINILKLLYEYGFTDVVLSSHYYSNRESIESFSARRKQSYNRLLRAASGQKVPDIHLGAEVYLTSLLFNNLDLTPLTVNGEGRYMLTELPYDHKLSVSTVADLERLCYVRSITPVLAHIERYPYLLDKKVLLPLLEMGCKVQVNYRAFTVPSYKRKLSKLVKLEALDALGTDVHTEQGLEPMLKESLTAIKENLGIEFLRGISKYSKEILINA